MKHKINKTKLYLALAADICCWGALIYFIIN